jgi:hypothetical protein
MAKTYRLTESQIPERRSRSLYADIVADFIAQGADTMQVTIEGMKPTTLRAGLRRALKGQAERGLEAGAKRRKDIPGETDDAVAIFGSSPHARQARPGARSPLNWS